MPSVARSAQLAVSALFFGYGLLFATLGLNMPGLRDALTLSETQLGFGLLMVSVGSLLTMPLTGRWAERWGSHRLTRLGAGLTFASLLLPFFSTSLSGLLLAFGILGLFNGVLDVALSAQGVTAEKAAERPLMSRLHAFYSLGGLSGALLGGLLVGQVPILWHVGFVTAIMLALLLWTSPRLLPDGQSTQISRNATADPAATRPSSAALMLGGLCFLGMFTEGTNYDWAALYYRDVLEAQAGQIAWGYGAFSGAMALGRWFGDDLRNWLGNQQTVQLGAALAALGMGLALVWPDVTTSTIGFALSGLGLSNVVPVIYSVAGHALASRGIATVATIGYAGFLLGPPLIGFLSDAVGLRTALMLAGLGAGLVALLAGRVFSALRS
ncbi:MFS transporter [Deinococcus radiophilus]|uniref:MFS transporter n=1 Tax=Deinococcus radiophilus TaxID=32062 RepID=A0A431VKA6_9DEIO|nr:MFS transporter [Deinococcus radiophilus]RTR21151.1 MFS transporter [Deinococcus radiophilus]UFA50226.1 MFS transporter [Deinococcus radiophilus]